MIHFKMNVSLTAKKLHHLLSQLREEVQIINEKANGLSL